MPANKIHNMPEKSNTECACKDASCFRISQECPTKCYDFTDNLNDPYGYVYNISYAMKTLCNIYKLVAFMLIRLILLLPYTVL